jgi:hypothetical protein
MIGESHEKLPEIGFSRGKKIIRYNFKQVEATKDTPAKWMFEQVMVEPEATRGEIIDAIIAQQYSKSDEIALINNKIAAMKDPSLTKYETEYATYCARREEAKRATDDTLKEAPLEPIVVK